MRLSNFSPEFRRVMIHHPLSSSSNASSAQPSSVETSVSSIRSTNSNIEVTEGNHQPKLSSQVDRLVSVNDRHVDDGSRPLVSQNDQVTQELGIHFIRTHGTTELHAVMDTGCQKTAVGRATLEHIASQLPNELPIKYIRKRFRFAGIGGETITNEMAVIPILLGSKPGVLRAAILKTHHMLLCFSHCLYCVHLSQRLISLRKSSTFMQSGNKESCFTMQRGNCVYGFLISKQTLWPPQHEHRAGNQGKSSRMNAPFSFSRHQVV